MKKTGLISFLLLLTLLLSCEELLTPDCGDCYEIKPDNTNLSISTGGGDGRITIFLTIYEGEIEDNIVVFADEVSTLSIFQFNVPVNKLYSAKATYVINDKTYYTVDAIQPRIELDKENCDEPCWFIRDYKMDLRLKYY